MKKFRIDEPCHENWADMTPTEKGAFCMSCSKEVVDFTNKSNKEIKRFFREMTEKSICGRIGNNQMESINSEFSHSKLISNNQLNRAMLFALIVVFGLNLFSCSDEKGAKKIFEIQNQVEQVLKKKENKEIKTLEVEKENSSTIESVISQSTATDSEFPIMMGEMTMNSEEIGLIEEIENNQITMGMMVVPYIDSEAIDTVGYENTEFETFDESIPTKIESKIFPNPTTGTSKIEMQIPKSILAELDLYDLSGRKLIEIHSGIIARGTFTKEIDLTFLPSGIYLVNIKARQYNESLQVIKL